MSYDFSYDPESGLTPWPMIWTVMPSQYNWEGTLGDILNFSVEAIPDPSYPSAWDAYYTDLNSSGNEDPLNPEPVEIPPLPPEPVLQEYIYESSSSLESEYFTLNNTDGLGITSVDTELFFPYAKIVYFKDGERKQAQFPQEAIDDGYDYVSAVVPDDREFIIENSDLRAISTAKTDLTGSFKFKINNDWGKARETLLTMSDQSKTYFDNLAGSTGNTDEPPSPANGNSPVAEPLVPDLPDLSTETDTIVDQGVQSYDELFREEDAEKINTIVNDGDFYTTLKNETTVVTSTQNTDEFGTVESPIDVAIREGNIEELMNEYGYSYSEVIELIRNV